MTEEDRLAIARDLINKCSQVNFEDYESKKNLGYEWAWQRIGFNKSETPPWKNSYGWDCIFVANMLQNRFWPIVEKRDSSLELEN